MAIYQIKLYNIPWSKAGKVVPIPESGTTPADALTKYQVGATLSTDKPFRTGQRELIIDNYSNALRSNYVSVEMLQEKPFFYWIDDIELLGTDSTADANVRLTISPDYFMTSMSQGDNVTITGDIIQSSRNYSGYEKRLPIAIDYSSILPRDFPLQENYASNKYTLIASTITAGGSIFQFFIRPSDVSTSTNALRQVSDAIGYAANIRGYVSKFVTEIPQSYNTLSLQKLYIVPSEWIFKNDQIPADFFDASSIITVDPDKGEVIKPAYTRGAQNFPVHQSPRLPTYSYNLSNKILLYPYSRAEFCTPARRLLLEGDPTELNASLIRLFVDISPVGQSDKITITAKMQDEYIDITDDFAIDFAINEQAVRNSQFKELYALQSLSRAISTGASGFSAVARGNVVQGVAQPVLGAVNSAVDYFARDIIAKRTPATMRGGGDALNIIEYSGLVWCSITQTPRNIDALNEKLTRYGYIYPERPRETIDEHSSGYYQAENVEITGLAYGGQEAVDYIVGRINQGVRFEIIT